MLTDRLTRDLYSEICRIPLIDPHSHINPHAATAKSLDDILGYHYYTELAHSAGMTADAARQRRAARERVRAILEHLDRIDNTVQYSWFLEIAQTFLGFKGERVSAKDCDCPLRCRRPRHGPAGLGRAGAAQIARREDLLDQRFRRPARRVRHEPGMCRACGPTISSFIWTSRRCVERLAKATGMEMGYATPIQTAIAKLFRHFVESRRQGLCDLAAARFRAGPCAAPRSQSRRQRIGRRQ